VTATPLGEESDSRSGLASLVSDTPK